MKKLNVIGALGFALLFSHLGACSHEETYTRKPYQPIHPLETSTVGPAKDPQDASRIFANVNIADSVESPAVGNEVAETFELEAHWANIIGTFHTENGEHLSTLEVSDTFKIKAVLHALEGNEEKALTPEFPDPLFYDAKTKTFYTLGSVKIQDDVSVEVELYLTMDEGNKLLKVSLNLIPKTKTLDMMMSRVKAE